MQKTIVNVGTIGHVDHGKTTLTAALTQVMAVRHGGAPRNVEQIDSSREEKLRGLTINLAHVQYDSATRRYNHVDCPGHADYIKNMIAGASQLDGAIVLVDATQGSQEQTREHILLARQVGVPRVVVFVNKMDVADPELVDLVVLDIDDLLRAHGYLDAPIVKGSALGALLAAQAGRLDDPWVATIDELVATLDRAIPEPSRDLTSPFLMTVEGVFSITGVGTIVTGCVTRGVVRTGDALAWIGGGGGTAVVTGIESFHSSQREASAGENVGLRLRGVDRDAIARGHVLIAPDSVRPHRRCAAELYLLGTGEGGRSRPVQSGYRPQLFIGATDVTATLELDGELAPGSHANVDLALDREIAIEPGVRFALREGGRTIGAGLVIGVA